MKQTSLSSITLTILFLTNQAFMTPSVKETVILKGGTPVSFKLCENKSSDVLEIGNTVAMITDDVVVVDGQTVIEKNLRAEGEVSDIRRRKDNRRASDKREQMDITVTRVKAVDGQYIDLHGSLLTVSSKCPKCAVELNPAMRLEAFVLSNTRIIVR